MPSPESSPAPAPFKAPITQPFWWLLLVASVVGVTWALFYTEAAQKWTGFSVMPIWEDTRAVLRTIDAHQYGIDVYHPNKAHVLHLYSNLWLRLGDFGLTRAQFIPTVLTVTYLFLVPALIMLRPTNRREFLWLLAFFSSNQILLGLYRANSDLVIFGLLAGVVPCMLSKSRTTQALAPILIVFCAALKYYPIIGACVIFTEPDKTRRRQLLLLVGIGFALALVAVYGELQYLQGAPKPQSIAASLGAPIFYGMLGLSSSTASIVGYATGLIVSLAAWFWQSGDDWIKTTATDWRMKAFILGAAILAGCYWVGGHWQYRLLALYGMLPLMLTPPREESMPPLLRRVNGPLRWILGFTLVSQTIMALIFWSCNDPLGFNFVMRLWWWTYIGLQICYFLIAIYGTVLVARLFYARLKEGF